MSYTALIPFNDGLPKPGVEFRNAWGGAARIWDALFEAYVPKTSKHDSWILDEGERIWPLAEREDLDPFERSVLLFTFDRFYVRKADFGRMAADLRLFAAKHPAGERVDHLPAWAAWMDARPGYEAVGLYGTSSGDNPWFHFDEDGEEHLVPLALGMDVYGGNE